MVTITRHWRYWRKAGDTPGYR